jgi:hypothetical protein
MHDPTLFEGGDDFARRGRFQPGIEKGHVCLPGDPAKHEDGGEHRNRRADDDKATSKVEDVTLLKPRILDVLNSYLRAIDTAAIEDPQAMARLRAQMLRRVQIVTGEGRVRDLLITEFVLN